MQIQKMIWLTAIAVAASSVVSVATVCVVVPMVVGQQSVVEKAAGEPSAAADHFAETENSQKPAPPDNVEDQQAIDTIKSNLGINLYSGTLLEDASANPDIAATEPRAEQAAAAALADAAERLEADGQSQAARLVRQAAKQLPISTAKAPQISPSSPR